MIRFTLRTILYLAIDVALVALCLYHIPYLVERAVVPFGLVDESGIHRVERLNDVPASGDLRVGDELLVLQGIPIVSAHDVEFISDFHSVDEFAAVRVRRSGMTVELTVRLIPYYQPRYIVLVLFVGCITWLVGVFVLLVRPRDVAASTLHLALVSMAVSVVMALGKTPEHDIWTFVSRGLYSMAYLNVGASFLLFTTLFPRHRQGSFLRKVLIIYLPALVILVPVMFFHFRALADQSLVDNAAFQTLDDLYHIAILVYVALGILNFVHSYRTTDSSVERKKLKWILWGLAIGPLPFLLLIVLPELFIAVSPIPEEYTLIFLVLIPFSFAISLIRYHVFDVEIVINRTTVYALVVALLVAAYLLIVGLVAFLVGTHSQGTYAIGAVLVALLFEPARTRIQHFVDKRFFRVRYDFRLAVRNFMERMKHCVDVQQLADLLVHDTDALIPVARMGFFTLQQPGNRLRCVAQKNFDMLQRRGIRFEPEKLKTRLDLPVAIDDKIEPGIPHETADERVFQRWGMALVIPMLSESFSFLGFLVLGNKKSGGKFTSEDIDLLNNVATQAGLEIERITLQQQLLQKQAEARQLAELNQLKSDFVSYVSHEFRTPLTSIKMYVEMLAGQRWKLHKKTRDYLKVIEGEAERLERMVTTVLDSAKIDQGVKQYHFEDTDLRSISRGVLRAMEYQLKKHKFKVDFGPGKVPLPIRADPDAVGQAMTNLIGNAIKYSGEKRIIRVVLRPGRKWATCSVIDHGRGIGPESLPHIFKKFYRDPSQSSSAQGVGLGLPLVRHIMDAHGGTVDVKSRKGQGSTFTLRFPVGGPSDEKEEKNPGG